MTSNLRSARANTLERCGSGIPSKSRKGWKVIVLSPRPSIMRRASAGVPLNDSKIVLEDLDAFELRGRYGFDLLSQGAAQANGGDGGAHARRSRFSRVSGSVAKSWSILLC